MIAVVCARRGQLPLGAFDVTAAASGHVLVVGDGTLEAAAQLRDAMPKARIRRAELGPYSAGAYAAALADVLADESVVILPSTPDGRDLAPHLAAQLGRPLLAGALWVSGRGAGVARRGGGQIADLVVDGPFVATLAPSTGAPSRPAVASLAGDPVGDVEALDLAAPSDLPEGPELLHVLAPDPATVDLAEAGRIVAGGAGLGGAVEFELLAAVAAQLGASVGATRVVTDAGIIDHSRQIGTTGVSVRPRCYISFGISGASQHVGGLGDPERVVSINTDPSCPMMAMSDLAVVADAEATLRALHDLLTAR